MPTASAANDLIVLFLAATELVSIPTYILLYLPRNTTRPSQGSERLKYFLLSVFSSGLTLFGFSYLYGIAGTTNLATLYDTLHRADPRDLPEIRHIAVIMVVAGLGFRVTIVPFHFYAPDVYQGTPTVGAARCLAFVPKVVGIARDAPRSGLRDARQASVPGSGYIGMALGTQVPIILWFLRP